MGTPFGLRLDMMYLEHGRFESSANTAMPTAFDENFSRNIIGNLAAHGLLPNWGTDEIHLVVVKEYVSGNFGIRFVRIAFKVQCEG